MPVNSNSAELNATALRRHSGIGAALPFACLPDCCDSVELRSELRSEVKQDRHNVETRLLGTIHQTDDRLLGKMQALEERLVEKMRDMQTELLRAFHDWARSMETRTRVLPLIDERLGILEDRGSKLERGEHPLH